MICDIFIILTLFCIYSLIHSLMASLAFKDWVKQKYPKYFSFYRLIYNIVQSLFFVFIWVILPKPSQNLWQVEGWVEILFRTGQALSIIGLISAMLFFNKSEFLGLAQIRRYFKYHQPAHSDEIYQLSMNGPYAISRHPIYLFTILLFLLEPSMTLFKFLLLIWLIVYFHIGSFFEERRLINEFGPIYISYQKEVSRILPFNWIKGCLIK